MMAARIVLRLCSKFDSLSCFLQGIGIIFPNTHFYVLSIHAKYIYACNFRVVADSTNFGCRVVVNDDAVILSSAREQQTQGFTPPPKVGTNLELTSIPQVSAHRFINTKGI